MRRVAAHWLFLPDGRKIHLPVVEIQGNCILNYYPLEDELPLTEWLGGVLIASPLSVVDTSCRAASGKDIIRRLFPQNIITYPLHCWSLNCIDSENEVPDSDYRLQLLAEED